MTKNISIQRTEYLKIIKRIVITASRMNSMIRHELCPVFHEDDKKKASKDLCSFVGLKNDLARLLDEQRAIETAADNAFGVVRLLRMEPNPALRTALCVLAAKVLSSEVTDVYTVAEMASMCAGRDVEGLLAIHLAFSNDGLLRKHCRVVNRSRSSVGALEDVNLSQLAFEILVGLATGTTC